MAKADFAGVLVPAITPFAARLEPDAPLFLKTCRWLLDQGANGLAVFGTTSEANLAGFCVRHHHLKHAGGGWQVRALPDGGLEWITPTGHRHVTRPYDYRSDSDPP